MLLSDRSAVAIAITLLALVSHQVVASPVDTGLVKNLTAGHRANYVAVCDRDTASSLSGLAQLKEAAKCLQAPNNYHCDSADNLVMDIDTTFCDTHCDCDNQRLPVRDISSSGPGIVTDQAIDISAIEGRTDGSSHALLEYEEGNEGSDQVFHDWALVCFRELPGTRWCMNNPRGYRCDSRGQVNFQNRESECDENCECKKVAKNSDKVGEVSGVSKLSSVSRDDVQTFHNWALVCLQDRVGTRWCMNNPRGYRCDSLGHVGFRHRNDQCDAFCECKKVSTSHEEVIGRGIDSTQVSVSHEEDVKVSEDDILVFHDWALVCHENRVATRWCMNTPRKYRCNSRGGVVLGKQCDLCNEYCECRKVPSLPSLDPSCLTSGADKTLCRRDQDKLTIDEATAVSSDEQGQNGKQTTASIARRSEDASDVEDSSEVADTADVEASTQVYHNYALVCFEDRTVTNFCISYPRSYNCNSLGQVTWKNKNDQCHAACECIKILAAAMFPACIVSSDGLTLCVRDGKTLTFNEAAQLQIEQETSAPLIASNDEEEEDLTASSTEVSSDEVNEHDLTATVHDYALVCSNDRRITEFCLAPPYGYSCDTNAGLICRRRFTYCSERCKCVRIRTSGCVYNGKSVLCLRDVGVLTVSATVKWRPDS